MKQYFQTEEPSQTLTNFGSLWQLMVIREVQEPLLFAIHSFLQGAENGGLNDWESLST